MIDVQLFRIATGEEVIAELVSENEDSVVIKNSLVVLPNGNGVGFAPWATVISKDEPEINIQRKFIIYMVNVERDVVAKYNQLFGSKLELPEEKRLIL